MTSASCAAAVSETAPYDAIAPLFPLPFELWPLQQDVVNKLAPLQRSAQWAEVGTGKTSMATLQALWQQLADMCDGHLILVPPILITQWVRWLEKVQGVSALAYRGKPIVRKKINLTVRDEKGKLWPAAHFIVMSMDIFKRDYARLWEAFKDLAVGTIVDEATCLKNCGSANFRHVEDFAIGRPLILLAGHPLAAPGDAYAYIKLLAPSVYRNLKIFESVHVGKTDFFGSVLEWTNLDVLQKNMEINTVHLTKRDVLPDLPQPIYMPLPYELDPRHLALYNQIAEEQILELESGGKIDATTVSKLYSCMQQLIINWDHFSEDPANVSAGFELMDEILAEIGAGQPGGRKLICYLNFQMTARSVMQRYSRLGVQLINGTVTSEVKRQLAIDTFINDPACSLIAIQPKSGGYGTDGLQHVSSDVLFLETPTSPIEFEQAVGRVYRSGQKNPPLIRIAVAERTIQHRLHRLLLNKDELTTFVQGGWRSLREALYGG